MTDRTSESAAWPSEHEVADELPIDCTAEEASRIMAAVPFWLLFRRKETLAAEGVPVEDVPTEESSPEESSTEHASEGGGD